MESKIDNLNAVLSARESAIGEVYFAAYDMEHKCLSVSNKAGEVEFHDIDREDISDMIVGNFLDAGASVRISDYDTTLSWLNLDN